MRIGCLWTVYFFFSVSGNIQDDWRFMNIKRASAPHQPGSSDGVDVYKVQRGSSVIAVGIYVFCFSLPVGCHAFVSPMLALLGARFCLVLWSICHEIEQLHLPIYRIRRKALLGSCTIGTSPLSMRWWILVACMPTSPITVSARTCQQWQVPPWPWILRTRCVESRKSNLRVVWRGSQRVN
jgi:hypothetical protein